MKRVAKYSLKTEMRRRAFFFQTQVPPLGDLKTIQNLLSVKLYVYYLTTLFASPSCEFLCKNTNFDSRNSTRRRPPWKFARLCSTARSIGGRSNSANFRSPSVVREIQRPVLAITACTVATSKQLAPPRVSPTPVPTAGKAPVVFFIIFYTRFSVSLAMCNSAVPIAG